MLLAHSVEKDPLENTVKLRESQDCNHKVISILYTICCIIFNMQLLADIRATEALRLGAGTGQTVAWHWLQQGGATAAPGIAAQSTEVEAAAHTQIQGHGVLVKLTHTQTHPPTNTHIYTHTGLQDGTAIADALSGQQWAAHPAHGRQLSHATSCPNGCLVDVPLEEHSQRAGTARDDARTLQVSTIHSDEPYLTNLIPSCRSFINMFKNNVRQELEGVKRELKNKKNN